MFAESFDDFRRKMEARPVAEFPFKVERLQTCMVGTPIHDEWIAKYLADENTDIHVTVESDHNTYTFYKIVARTDA